MNTYIYEAMHRMHIFVATAMHHIDIVPTICIVKVKKEFVAHTHSAQSERTNMFELVHANVVLLILLLLVLLFFRGFIIVCVDLATARDCNGARRTNAQICFL